MTSETDEALATRAPAPAPAADEQRPDPEQFDDDGAAPATQRRLQLPRGVTGVLLLLAVVAPVALFTWRAMHAPINFDGAMNLQVAQRLATGEGYTRFYGELRTFPHEVQTNGPYIWIATLGIMLFGEGQFAYQFSNLVFLAGFVAVTVLILWKHPALRVAAPLLVLLAIPGIPLYGLSGLGEIPTSFFLFGAVLALVQAVRLPDRAPHWVLAASVAFGAAIATKTFAVGAAGALLAGLACALVAVPTWRQRRHVILACGGVVLVPTLQELLRLVSVGSLGGYRAWWTRQRMSISNQTGFKRSGSNPLQTGLDHMHVLSQQVDWPAELLVIAFTVPMLVIAGLVLWRVRQRGFRRTMTDPSVALLLVLGVLAASYIGWWVFLIPDAKLWIRRMIPGLLALHLLYFLLIPHVVRSGRSWLRRSKGQRAIQARIAAGSMALGVVLMTGVAMTPYAWENIRANTRGLLNGQEAWLDATEEAAAYVEANGDKRFYGDGWWSAPVVSLMSGTGFHDLTETAICSLDLERDRLVWDRDAKMIRSTEPWDRDGAIVFEEMADFGSWVTIYAMGPASGECD